MHSLLSESRKRVRKSTHLQGTDDNIHSLLSPGLCPGGPRRSGPLSHAAECHVDPLHRPHHADRADEQEMPAYWRPEGERENQ